MDPLINVITRVSRKNFFKRCRESLLSQKYKNVNHICTYESKEIGDFLQSFTDLSLVKVPNFKRIPNLFYSYNHHDLLDDFVDPDWEFQQKLAHTLMKDFRDKKIPVEQKQYGEYKSSSFTSRPKLRHCPYNSYVKIAESKINDGWVFYLDDDDYFHSDDFLQMLKLNILENNEDTLHIFRKISTVGKTMPSEISWSKIKSGHPVILHDFGTSCFCFHSKYLDYTVWDEWSGADYRTAKALEKMIPNKNYIENISIVFGSNDGESVDLF